MDEYDAAYYSKCVGCKWRTPAAGKPWGECIPHKHTIKDAFRESCASFTQLYSDEILKSTEQANDQG